MALNLKWEGNGDGFLCMDNVVTGPISKVFAGLFEHGVFASLVSADQLAVRR